MDHGFAIELLWRFSRLVECHGFPSSGHCYCPAQSPPTPGASRSFGAYIALGPYSSSYLCAPPTVHLADTRPHSPTSLAYKSITHTSFIGSTHTIYRKGDHAPTCAYLLLSFPICPLGSHTSRFLIAFFPDDALNPPSSLPPYPRRHVFVPGIAVSTSGHHFSSSLEHHLRSIICLRLMTGPSHSPSTSTTCTTPATRSPTAAQVTLTSTIANAATTMTPSGVTQPLS